MSSTEVEADTSPDAVDEPDETRARLDRRQRAVRLVAWGWTALVGVVALSQAMGWTLLVPIYALQALTPLVFAPSVPFAAIAAWRRRWALAGVHVGVTVALLVLVVPVLAHGNPPDVPPGAPTLRIAFGNMYYDNPDPAAAAARMLTLDADLIGMAEYTPAEEREMELAGAFAAFPYRTGRADWDRDGIVLYSRWPFVSATETTLGTSPAIDAVIDVDGTDVRVLIVHPKAASDQSDLDDWEQDLAAIHREMGAADGATHTEATAVVGDFNASHWHPAFRDLLDGTSFHDVHEWLGEGFSRSWPNDEPFPPFVRIDHALVRGLVPTELTDVDVPGSDHRGFVTTLAVVGGA